MARDPRTPVVDRRVGWLIAGVLALSVCQGAAAPSESTSGSPAASSPSSDGSTEPTEGPTEADSADASPEIAPATGPLIRQESASVRAPKGWKLSPRDIHAWEASASRPNGGGLITLLDMPSLGTWSQKEIYKAMVPSLPDGAKVKRLPNVQRGGYYYDAVHVTYTLPDDDNTDHWVATERDGRSITIDFTLKPRDLKRDPDLVDAVIASFR